MTDSDFPFVSIIMPIRNEATYIERSLTSVLAQDYPHDRMEVLVADGMSTDATRARIMFLVPGHSDVPVTLLDNPDKIVPTGFNRALALAKGAVIIRVDGHCEIATDYIRRCVEKLDETGVACVGGPITTIGTTWNARSIARAQSSHFGVGGVAFRTDQDQVKGGYVDTVAFGAYRREVFTTIGDFDEELVCNEDDEFNFRLIQSGGKIWLDPAIRSVYYSRASLGGLWRQYFRYGFYKVRVIQKRGAVPAWRHLVPGLFVLGLIGSLLLSLVTCQRRYMWIVAGPYAAANITASIITAQRNWRTLPLLPVVFIVLHLSYGLGFLYGVWYWIRQSMSNQ
jgi:cellulose synthase/poly-beta-1,6-N-acetylglucosamine synthase-like glycosyltransferase